MTAIEAKQRSTSLAPEAASPGRQLVHSHIPFVIKLTKEYRTLGVPFEDLLHEGTLGLLQAARRFDEARGVRFTTYAAWWIRKFLLKAVKEQTRIVRIPDHHLRRIQAARAEHARDSQRLGREADRRPLASTPVEVSLTESRDGDRQTLADTLADHGRTDPEKHAVRIDMEQRLGNAVSRLSERTWRVLRDRFGLERNRALTLKEIGEREGISRERARQIEMDALRQLRRELTRRPRRRALAADA